MSLKEILQKHFGCKKPFLKRKRVVGYWSGGEPDYEYMTRAGGKAYEELVGLLGDLGILLGEEFEAHLWIKELDRICNLEDE